MHISICDCFKLVSVTETPLVLHQLLHHNYSKLKPSSGFLETRLLVFTDVP